MNQPLTKANGRFSQTEIDDEVVVMSLESGDFFSLTGTARAIWDLIDGTRDRAAILDQLAQGYGSSAEEIAADFDAFIAQVRAAGLLDPA